MKDNKNEISYSVISDFGKGFSKKKKNHRGSIKENLILIKVILLKEMKSIHKIVKIIFLSICIGFLWNQMLINILNINISTSMDSDITVNIRNWNDPIEGQNVKIAWANSKFNSAMDKNVYNPAIHNSGLINFDEKNFDPFKLKLIKQTRWPIRVAIFRGKGASIRSWHNIKHILKCANNTIHATVIKNANIATINRKEYDVFIIPGGEAGDMNEWHTKHGSNLRTTVQKFLKNGGGYVGFCAGAYLARGPLGLSPFRKASTTLGVGWFSATDIEPWFENHTKKFGWTVNKQIFDKQRMYYANGPIFQEMRNKSISNENVKNPRVIMRTGAKSILHIEHGPVPGTKAHDFPRKYQALPISTYNEFSNGKVLLSTVHPETNSSNGIHSFEVLPTECSSEQANFITSLVLIAANRTNVPIISRV